VLAAGFGWPSLRGWDTTSCGVALWGVFASSFDAAAESLRPSVLLETQTSVLSLACHPDVPGVVAAGCQTGEVVVWDTAASASAPRATSPIDLLAHQHPVRALAWVRPSGSPRHVLVSGCEAGHLLVWDPLGAGMGAPVAGATMRPTKVRPRMRESDWPDMSDLADDDDDNDSGGGGGARAAGGSRRGRPRRRRAAAVPDGIAALAPLSDGSAVLAAMQSGGVATVSLGGMLRAYDGVSAVTARRGHSASGEHGWAEDARGHWGEARARSVPPGASLAWTSAAASLVAGVGAAARTAVVRSSEHAAKEAGAAAVAGSHVLAGRPEEADLLPALGSVGSAAGAALELTPHPGPATAAAASPAVRALTATAGVDGTVRVRSTLQRDPLGEAFVAPMRVESATAVAFSRSRPLVLACGGQGGGVVIIDGERSLASAAAELECSAAPAGLGVAPDADSQAAAASAEADFSAEARRHGLLLPDGAGAAVTSLAFSRTQRRVLAAADGSGCVRVWRMPWSMSQPVPGEAERAARLARGGAEEGAAAATEAESEEASATSPRGGDDADPIMSAVSAAKARAGGMRSTWDE